MAKDKDQAAAPAPEPAAAPMDPVEEKARQLVEGWVQEGLANSEFSSYTPAWNHFTAAREDLVRRITQALKGA